MVPDEPRISFQAWSSIVHLQILNLMSEYQQTILVVDDESSIRKLLRRCFEKESYRVLEAENGSEMHLQLQSHTVDLITLDLSLGKDDGLNLARDIRATSSIPIIMVSGKGDLIDTVLGLEMGADDYINKPFELREVIARVRAVLRRHENKSSVVEQKISSKNFHLNWHINFVYTRGRAMGLDFQIPMDDGYTLDERYTRLTGRVFLTGTQALLRR